MSTNEIIVSTNDNDISVIVEDDNLDITFEYIGVPGPTGPQGEKFPNASIEFILDGAGQVVQTGVVGDLIIPFACIITGWTLIADQVGSIVVDIWKTSYTDYPPTISNSITGTGKPSLVMTDKAQSNDLSGWTPNISLGDIIRYNIVSSSLCKRITLGLQVTRL